MSEAQKEIVDKLLERYDKNLDRFIPLLQFVFVILGFYSSIVIHYGILGEVASLIKDDKPISYFSQPTYSIISFSICYASVIFAILILTYQIKMGGHQFEKVDDLIQFIEAKKLEKHNRELFSSINKQSKCYNVSITLITVSLFSFIEYFFLRDPSYKSMNSFLFILLILIIIIFSICVLQLLHFLLCEICTYRGIVCGKISSCKDTLIAWVDREIVGKEVVSKEVVSRDESKGNV